MKAPAACGVTAATGAGDPDMDTLREAVAQIKARSDCRSAARELGPPRRYNAALCPFCDDHDPSPSAGATGFKCHACGPAGGDDDH